MTATACFPHFMKGRTLDFVHRNGICSGRDSSGLVDSCRRQDNMETDQNVDRIRTYTDSDYVQRPRCACPITSSVMATTNRPARGIKRRRSSFSIEMRPPSCKWIRLESFPGSADVIHTTSDLEDRNIELGASSGIPSPVDDDDKSNDSLEPGVLFEDDETTGQNYIPFYHYGAFPAIRNSVCVGDTANSWNVPHNVYDVINSRLLSDPSTDVQSHGHVTFIEHSRHDPRSIQGLDTLSGKSVALSSFYLDLNSCSTLRNKLTVDKDQDGNISCSPSDCLIPRVEKSSLALSRTLKKFMSKEWKKLLKAMKGFMLVLRPDRTIVYVSSNVSECLGFHQDQMIDQSIALFIHPSHHPLVRHITCSSPRDNGEQLGGQSPEARHCFPVDMRFEFQKDDRGLSTGYRTVQCFLRPVLLPGEGDNCVIKNVVSIYLPCVSTPSLYAQRKLMTILGLQDWNLFRVFHPLGTDLRHLTVKCQRSFCSLATVTCLSCLKALLMAGCALCGVPKTTHSETSCRSSWCVTHVNSTYGHERPKCFGCRFANRANDGSSGGVSRVNSKSTTCWKAFGSSKGFSSPLQSLQTSINLGKMDFDESVYTAQHNYFQYSPVKDDKMTIHQLQNKDVAKDRYKHLDALFQDLQGNSKLCVENERINKMKWGMNDLPMECRMTVEMTCKHHGVLTQECRCCDTVVPSSTNASDVCDKGYSYYRNCTEQEFPMNTNTFERLQKHNINPSIQTAQSMSNSLSLSPIDSPPSKFSHDVRNQSRNPESISSDFFEFYKNTTDLMCSPVSPVISSNSFHSCLTDQDNWTTAMSQVSSEMSPQTPGLQNLTGQYKDFECSTTPFLKDNSNQAPKLQQMEVLSETESSDTKPNHYWPMIQSHNTSHVGNGQTNFSSPLTSNQENGNQNILPSICPPNFSSHDINLENLEEIDFTSEFPFPGSDVVMPVENGLECVSDLVLNSSSQSIMDLNSVSDPNENEENLDLFSTPPSNDFTDSFEVEMQRQSFEPFGNLLSFSSSDLTPSSISVTNSFTLNTPTYKNAEINEECSNDFLIEINDIVPQNKDPFEKRAGPAHQFASPKKSYSTLRDLFSPSTEKSKDSRKSSLLRTLLNKGEVMEQTSPSTKWRQQMLHRSGLSQQRSRPNSSHESKTTNKTKELPVPKTRQPRKRSYHLFAPTDTRELPLPSKAMNETFSSRASAQTPETSDSCRNSETENENVENMSSLCQTGNSLLNMENNSDNMDAVLNDEDTLPDDLVDLAMEYCNSLDDKEPENFITELNEQFNWDGNLDLFNSSASINTLCQTSSSETNLSLNIVNAPGLNVQLKTGNHSRPNSSVCLPLSNRVTPKPQKESPSTSRIAETSSVSSVHIGNSVSLLRQAVTSPDVDKLIEQIPLGRKFLMEKSRSGISNKSDIYNRNTNINSETIQSKLQNFLQSQNTNKMTSSSWPQSDKSCVEGRHFSGGSSKTTLPNSKSSKTAAVSHISISVPLHCSSKTPHIIKPRVSPVKVKITPSGDISKQKASPLKQGSSSLSKTIKTSSCPNSSSEPVSVMVMRKENHRSRRCKTVATQTENSPGEVYPALELSPSDVIMTPSVYLDTSHSSQSPKSISGSKSPLHNCNIFLSSLQSLASPGDSKELTVSSPSPRHASPSSSSSTSSLPELELHLRGLNSPASSTSSPSSEADMSSGIPFLQRLLTGELSKDRYEKLDKDLLKRQRSGSGESSPHAQY